MRVPTSVGSRSKLMTKHISSYCKAFRLDICLLERRWIFGSTFKHGISREARKTNSRKEFTFGANPWPHLALQQGEAGGGDQFLSTVTAGSIKLRIIISLTSLSCLTSSYPESWSSDLELRTIDLLAWTEADATQASRLSDTSLHWLDGKKRTSNVLQPLHFLKFAFLIRCVSISRTYQAVD